MTTSTTSIGKGSVSRTLRPIGCALLASLLVWSVTSLAAADVTRTQRSATDLHVAVVVTTACSFDWSSDVADIHTDPTVAVHCQQAQRPVVDTMATNVVNALGATTPVLVTTVNF